MEQIQQTSYSGIDSNCKARNASYTAKPEYDKATAESPQNDNVGSTVQSLSPLFSFVYSLFPSCLLFVVFPIITSPFLALSDIIEGFFY